MRAASAFRPALALALALLGGGLGSPPAAAREAALQPIGWDGYHGRGHWHGPPPWLPPRVHGPPPRYIYVPPPRYIYVPPPVVHHRPPCWRLPPWHPAACPPPPRYYRHW